MEGDKSTQGTVYNVRRFAMHSWEGVGPPIVESDSYASALVLGMTEAALSEEFWVMKSVVKEANTGVRQHG